MRRTMAVITGGGSGIGAAITRRLANEHDLLITHRTRDDNLAAVMSAARDAGASIDTITGDLTDPATLTELTNAIDSQGERISVLVGNAGAYPRIPLANLTTEQLQYSLDLHVHTHIRCVQAVRPHMIGRDHGRIILITSVLTQIGRTNLTHYIAAKGALEAAAHALARELGPHNITVNTVRPGSIEVPAEHAVVDDHAAMVTRQLGRQCIQRRGQPADVAAAVAFLASNDAGFITGQTLTVDGGWCPS